jgi:DNA invertase Pin-like site-specific DNA recombinase
MVWQLTHTHTRKPAMQAVAYVRVSTDEQAESRAGLEAQLHAVTQHCQKNGIQLVGTFTDAGVSGAAALDKRPGLLDAVNAVTRGGVLLVAKRDRLARDVVACAVVERMVAKRGGRVVSVAGEGTDNDDATSVLMRRIVDAFSEHERLVIAARTRAALQAKKRRGERAGRIPFGYQLADNGARSRAGNPVALAAVPAQLAVVERIRRERAAGRSMRAIAKGLTDDKVPTATGAARWAYSSVQRVLQRFNDVAEATADVLHGMTQPAGSTTLSEAVA